MDLAAAPSAAGVAYVVGGSLVDADSAREAIRTRSSFTVFHRATIFEIDLFALRALVEPALGEVS